MAPIAVPTRAPRLQAARRARTARAAPIGNGDGRKASDREQAGRCQVRDRIRTPRQRHIDPAGHGNRRAVGQQDEPR